MLPNTYISQCILWVLLGNFTFASVHFRIQTHANFAQDLLVNFIGLPLYVAGVHCHVHLVIHHFWVHFHFLRLLCEFPKHISDLTHVHLLVDAGHYLVDSFQCIDHVLVDCSRAQLHFYCFQLAAHYIILVNLLPSPHEIFRHNFSRTVLVFGGQGFYILKKLFFLRYELFLFTVNSSDCPLNLAFVLLGDFLWVDLRCFVSHLLIIIKRCLILI